MKSLDMILDGIKEQCEKRQYWNAIGRATYDLLPLLMKLFDSCLKNDPAREAELLGKSK